MARPRANLWRLSGFERNAKQGQAWRHAQPGGSRFLGYGGALGGGKSHLLRWLGIMLLVGAFRRYGLRGVPAMLCCETYAALHDRHVVAIEAGEPYGFPGWLGGWRKGVREFHLAPEYGGGRLCLRNLDNPAKYLSSQWPYILWDECTQCVMDGPEGVFDGLVHRMRWPGIPTRDTRMVLATNPGGIGHESFCRRFIRREFRSGERESDFAFVQALPRDNPLLDADYWEALKLLPAKLYTALVEGRWDVFAGQMFSEWDDAVHVLDPFRLPEQWPRSGAIDYGFSPGWTWAGYVATDPVRGLSYCYRELYAQEMGPAEVAQWLIDHSQAGERRILWQADPSLWQRNEQTGKSNADVMAAKGLLMERADNARVSGWYKVHDYLRVFDAPWPDYLPGHEAGEYASQARLRFFRTCPEVIRTLKALPHADTGDPEDADTDAEDHAPDGVRYWAASRPAHETKERDVAAQAAARREERRLRDLPGYRGRQAEERKAGY